jgi:glycosyltransferase involved in cell wall biosynthesis
MKVSVITVCKNSERSIEKAIQSLVSQTYGDIEYIVIDGASEDSTKAIINQYASHITRFISEPDSGIYQAMNKGIRMATGSLLYFLNSDDYLFDNNVIQDIVDFFQQHPCCDLVYGDHEARFSFGKSSFHQPAPPERMVEEMVYLGECLMQPASFFKADLFSKLGFFSEHYKIAADYEWFARLLQDQTLRLCYYPRVMVSYSHGGASSNIRDLFQEVFEIQNNTPLYQNDDWLHKRMAKLQSSFIDKYDLLNKTHTLSNKREQHIIALESKVNNLESKISGLTSEIAAMKTSKFWQLRKLWFSLKKRVGLPIDD